MKLEDILQDVIVNKAKAFIKPAKGFNVRGKVVFTQVTDGVKVFIDLRNVPPGEHGFHVHEYANCSGDFEEAGGHFNPGDNTHGKPGPNSHAGDLGNIKADKNGKINTSFTTKSLSFEGPTSLLNKSIIVHEKPDDFKTQPTGDAGKRIGCGIIKEA